MKTKMIYTKFWDDSYVQELETDEKLVFLALFTNAYINQIGVYEISKPTLTFITGVERGRVAEVLEKLHGDEKIISFGDWVAIRNIHKYNSYNGSKNLAARKSQWEDVPAYLKDIILLIEDKDYVKFVTGESDIAASKILDAVEAFDVGGLVEEFKVNRADTEASYQNFRDYNKGSGRVIVNEEAAFRTWLRNDIRGGKVKTNEKKEDWDSLEPFKKRQMQDMIEAGTFEAGWRPPPGTPQKIVNKFNEWKK